MDGADLAEPVKLRRTAWLSAAVLIALVQMAPALEAAPADRTEPQAGVVRSLVRVPRKPKVQAPAADTTHMAIDAWASLSQGYNPLGKAEARVDLRAHDETTDDIIVYGKKFQRPVQELSIDQIGAEPAQSDAAQPLVPFLGSGCDKGSACVDPGQLGLRYAVPELFGAH
jgi:hypothetical protein